jgi:hypothetical protein
MPQRNNSPLRIQFGVRGWAAIAVAIAMLVAIVLLAIGFFILVLPLLLLAPILIWLLPKPKIYRVDIPSDAPPANDATTIEGDFHVIDVTSDGTLKPPDTLGP